MSLSIRTFGWVQNPSSFSNLKKTVQIFDNKSEHYLELKNKLVDEVIFIKDIKDSLQSKLDRDENKFTYIELVGRNVKSDGTSAEKRSKAVADSLIQISILPQKNTTTGKKYTDNWTADGFLRWATTLNFLEHNRKTDTFKITESGLKFSKSENDSEEENEILRAAFLSYPPATRVLDILDRAKNPVNKFEIGQSLGFTGEKGFTSYDSELMKDLLREAPKKDENKIRSDIEGTSDKYARMIANWLYKVKFVEKHTQKEGDITMFQGYSITALGKIYLNRSKGKSKHRKKPKFLMWEFLATNISSKDYVRTRRAVIIQQLMKSESFRALILELTQRGFKDDISIIKKDIRGLINFGLRIKITEDWSRVTLQDNILNFDIPQLDITQEEKDHRFDKEKAFFLNHTNIPDKFVELIPIAHNGHANRDFELITTELLRDIYGFNALHLGGGLKPDGIAFTSGYGIIYDTKSYAKGYLPSIGEKDKMIRYTIDNQLRDINRNKTEWWKPFPNIIPENAYYSVWISSYFKTNIDDDIEYVSNATNKAKIGALDVHQLLIGASKIQKGELVLEDIPKYIKNELIIFDEKISLAY
ncbi:restriction endonuclease FokI C-terminal domain-containing protein [Ruoffia sp. FAM 26254]|uniref:restriction endonuclease FokI C-terminal domain-containing protein n=1 Tax=unclassified Ruoffia TaxID=2862149 RepID=UPI003887F2CE